MKAHDLSPKFSQGDAFDLEINENELLITTTILETVGNIIVLEADDAVEELLASRSLLDEASLGTALEWPEIVNKVGSVMRAMGWKAQRQNDDAYMFTTQGQEAEDQIYVVIIENRGSNMFSYALGTFEGGRPDIGEQDTLPNTEASVSELINSIREGFGLAEQAISAPKVNDQGMTQGQWLKQVRAKYPTATIIQAKMIDGPVHAHLPGGRKISWIPANKMAESASPMIKPPTNRFDTKQEAFAHAKAHGGKVFKRTYVDPNTGNEQISYVVKKESAVKEESSTVDTVTLDVPLMIRVLEYAREDAQTDMDLHNVAEKLTQLAQGGETLTMNDYDAIVANNQEMEEAKYGGREVKLGKPMSGDVRKYKVYVKNPKTGNIKKVNFGDPNMQIRRDNPKARKSFRARHGCGTPRASDRTKAAYWSCRMWSSKPVSKILKGK